MKGDITAAESNAKRYLMYGVYAIVIVAVCIVILKIIQAAKAGAAVAGDVAGQAIIAAQTGISANRQIVCKNVATTCANATSIFLKTVLWVGNDEIIPALNTLVSPQEAKLTSQFYMEQTGFSLKSILDKSVYLGSKKVNDSIYQGLE